MGLRHLRDGIEVNQVPDQPNDVAGGVVQLDAEVAGDFDRALAALARAGAHLVDTPLPLLPELAETLAKSNFPAVEVHARLGDDLAQRGDLFDPIVRMRMELARGFPAADFMRMRDRRFALHEAFDILADRFDAFVLPTVPVIAPRMADLHDRDAFLRANAQTLRNTSIANFFDLPSISLPMHAPGAAPTGFMLFGRRMRDRALFGLAAAVEKALRREA